MPDRSILQKMATAAYSSSPPQMIDGWTLLVSTPTLKFYRSENVIVVAIRGTEPSDKRDLEADAKIALNKLETTPRYQSDLTTLLNVMKKYPANVFEYYGVGHSLGGAILDSFIKDGWIRNGVSYNPAVQPKNLTAPIPNQRIYQSGDPLYQVFGRFTPNVEVRPPKKKTVWESLVRKVPYVGSLFGYYKDHLLDNFEGGGTHRENVLKKYKLKDEGYSIPELAKITGIPTKTLREVYNRGIGAYKTNPTSVRMKGSFKKNVEAPLSKKLSKEQWAMARVYSFIDGNPKHDSDLRLKGGSLEDTYSRWVRKVEEEGEIPDDVAEDVGELFIEDDTAEGDAFRQLVADYADENDIEETADVLNSANHLLAVLRRGLEQIRSAPRPPPSGGGSAAKSQFLRELKEIGLTPTAYLREARRRAKQSGYDSKALRFAEDGIHKLVMTDPKGRQTKFGRVGYKDHLMWSHLERQRSVEEGTAEAKKRRFQTSHRAMKGDWKKNPYSANWLALRVLW